MLVEMVEHRVWVLGQILELSFLGREYIGSVLEIQYIERKPL